MYLAIKHIHMTAVALSVSLFILRFAMIHIKPELLQKKLLKILPHVIDTVLLASAVALCIILSQYPIQMAWLTEKVVGVILYILMGLWTLKWARNLPMRWIGFVGALTWLAIIGKVAVTKQPVFF